jgi:hypothetical protein
MLKKYQWQRHFIIFFAAIITILTVYGLTIYDKVLKLKRQGQIANFILILTKDLSTKKKMVTGWWNKSQKQNSTNSTNIKR